MNFYMERIGRGGKIIIWLRRWNSSGNSDFNFSRIYPLYPWRISYAMRLSGGYAANGIQVFSSHVGRDSWETRMNRKLSFRFLSDPGKKWIPDPDACHKNFLFFYVFYKKLSPFDFVSSVIIYNFL